MKINFRKISALATSMLMVGMTAGVAGAANYPAPFVVGGTADVAIVYGSGANNFDVIQAGNIRESLEGFMSGGGGSSVTGGDSFKFEKTSTKFNLGDNITGVISTSIDEDELPILLADGIFVDDDNDEFDFTQKIDISADLQLTMFEDNDYVEDQPTIGFRIGNGENILNYTIEFSDEPLVADLATADLTLMGKTYYILTQTYTNDVDMVLTLLDSAEDTILQEGSSVTLSGKTVSIDFISSTEVAFNVDGEFTNTLEEAQTQKLSDGSYLGVKDIRFSSKDGTLSSVEFSIGSGKLKLQSGSEVQINDDNVPGLIATIVNTSTTLTSIKLSWDAEDDMFITTDSSIELPEFKSVKLSFGGLNYPTEETIEVKQGGSLYAQLDNFPIKDGSVDINFLYGTSAGTFSGIGKDANNRLVTDATNITYDKDTDDYFVVSWSDTTDSESYLMRATSFITESGTDKVNFQYKKNGVWTDKKTKAKDTDTFSIGNADLTVGAVSNSDNSVVVTASGNTNFNILYSSTGLKIFLPVSVNNDSTGEGHVNLNGSGLGGTGHDNASFYLVMWEEDKNGNTASGDFINVTVGWDNSATKEVEVSSIATSNTDATATEILDTNVDRDFTYSALATEILFNKPSGSAQNSVKIIYHGDEVTADVFITSSDAVITAGGGSTGGSLGSIIVTDNEVNSVSSKHLIVIGGSCINSVAAKLVGGALCGSAWTSATGVGSGQFLIQSYGDVYSDGKIALLVAGYEFPDTVNAATFLRNNDVDTSEGTKYIGTSSTDATVVVS